MNIEDKYTYRWTSRYNGSTKYRLTSPSRRTINLLDFIVKRCNGKISFSHFHNLLIASAYKFHATRSSESAFINSFFGSGWQYPPVSVFRGVPAPIMVVNVNVELENTYCNAEKIKSKRKRPRVRHDIFYLWMDENHNTKVGITSTKTISNRIQSCANRRGSRVMWSIKFKTKNARSIESEILTRFIEKPYSHGDGHTEFRVLSKIDIDSIIEYVVGNGGIEID